MILNNSVHIGIDNSVKFIDIIFIQNNVDLLDIHVSQVTVTSF